MQAYQATFGNQKDLHCSFEKKLTITCLWMAYICILLSLIAVIKNIYKVGFHASMPNQLANIKIGIAAVKIKPCHAFGGID